MSPAIEEILYPALEDYELDIVIGQGPGARSVKVPLQPFTLVGATTRAGLLTSPLRARFGIVHRLDFYAPAGHRPRSCAGRRGSSASRSTTRRRSSCRAGPAARRASPTGCCAASATTRRCAPTARSPWRSAHAALALLEVDEHGFDEIDRRLLRTIIDKFGGGPVGLNTIAAAISEEPDAIEDIYEPFLIQIGFLDRTPRGRVATALAYRVLRAHRAREGTVDCGNAAPPRGASTIDSLATYVPPRLLTNADLEKMVETTDEWILQRTGIRERHIVDPGVATSDLAAEAAREAIAKAGLRPDQIELIIVGTTTPDTMFPSTACLVQHKIGATRAWGFDLGAACSGFTYSLATAAQFIASGVHQHALVIGADVMSSIIDYTDRTTCVLFGDGAGAVVAGTGRRRSGRRGHHRLLGRDRRLGRPGAVHAGRRQPQAGLARHRRPAAPLRAPGRADGLQVRRPQDRGDLPAAARAQRPGRRPTSTCWCRTRPTAGSSSSPPRSSASTRPGSSSTSSGSATPPPRRFRWRWPTRSATAACGPATGSC